ncbi:MAG: glycoside hydrolase family 65 protein, partial [Rariglobus sp.]
YYALRQLPYSILIDVTVTPKKDLTLGASSGIQTPDAFRDTQNYYHEISKPHTHISLLTSSAKSPTGKLLMCASNAFIFPEPHGGEPKVVHEMPDNDRHLMRFYKKLKAGESYRYAIVGSTLTSAHHSDPLNEAERLTIYAKLQGRESLVKRHNEAWDKLWQSDIILEPAGPENAGEVAQTQQAVRSMLYHLYSFVREGTSNSPSPMGLSGLGYNGHVFWDSEIWMFPPLLQLHPEMAKSMVEYRFERLEAARRNAFGKGYRGAMYPWESADNGAEETPVTALTGPFEHHITADVALAVWNYYCVTHDKAWLKEKGWPILKNTADFWASRVEGSGQGRYDINNVVAADEWAENVDNNAFTNAAAKANLRCATEAAKVLEISPDPHWAVIADGIPILKMADGVTSEHATYKGEGIKQADVNLLSYPLSEIRDPAQMKRDVDYYSSRVPNTDTPAMTQAIFSVLYSRLGDGEKAYHFLNDAYVPNLLPPFHVIADSKGGANPYFATGAGGVLLAMINGFCGLEITPYGFVQLKSALPKEWKRIRVTGVGPEKKTFTTEHN